MEEAALFGGSISISLPKSYIDLSDLRQVPDNQEVFVDKEGEGSIIIELLETPSSDIEFEQGIKYHVDQLVEETGDTILSYSTINHDFNFTVPNCKDVNAEAVSYRIGNDIENRAVLLRFPSKTLDILISFNRISANDSNLLNSIISSFTIKNFDFLQ